MTTQVDRKKMFQLIIIGLILLAATITLLVLGAFKPRASSHKVLFQVNASGGYALITLKTPRASILSPTIVTTPWRMEITLEHGSEVYLTAANPTQTGELSCSISLDNRIWKSMEKAAPQNGIACAGIVP